MFAQMLQYRAQRAATEQRQAAIAASREAVEPKRKPGFCRHCGEHIGKGVAFHERKCRQSQT